MRRLLSISRRLNLSKGTKHGQRRHDLLPQSDRHLHRFPSAWPTSRRTSPSSTAPSPSGPFWGSKSFPPFLPLPAVLLPFVVVFFCLLVCLLPRYPRAGRATLPITRNASPDDFHVPESWAVTIEQQQTLCLILCNILYWKAKLLQISFAIYIIGTLLVAYLLAYEWF